jgi:chromosome partitioning protein
VQTILIANPKGGSGKSTLATNLAGWLAGKRQRVALGDSDPQRSASDWLARRPPLFPPIAGFTGEPRKKELKDIAPAWLVVDSPAGLHGEALRDAVRHADILLVPVSPSTFDMGATRRFLETGCRTEGGQGRRGCRWNRGHARRRAYAIRGRTR